MATVLSADLPFMSWTWEDVEPLYRELEQRPIDAESVDQWLRDWTAVTERVAELERRLRAATTQDVADEEAAARYHAVVESVSPRAQEAEQRLQQKLLDSGLEPPGMEVPLRGMRVDAALFRQENLALEIEEKLLIERYFQIVGAQTVRWEGQEVPVVQMLKVQEETDRDKRERAWRASAERTFADRDAINELWRQLLPLRLKKAANAGYDSYRDFRWQEFHRFDYGPDDAQRFDEAVEQVVVPVVARLRRRRRDGMGLDALRPWDLRVDPDGQPPLRPFADVTDLEHRASIIFHKLDPELGAYFDRMERERLLDLGSRPNKAPGGYLTTFPASRQPFIFANVSGTRQDVETLLHEGGHAFHAFESAHLPYIQQQSVPMEFAEVASMAMEFLAEPYLPASQGGFYTESEAARARVNHLEQRVLALWCLIAMVDAFQQWVYQHTEDAMDPEKCDAEWLSLQQRYNPEVDLSGLEREVMSGWQSVLHIMAYPFYMIDYGIAQFGAVQIWANARQHEARAVEAYRRALALGGTRTLPDLFAVAGARFGFDATALRTAVDQIEQVIDEPAHA